MLISAAKQEWVSRLQMLKQQERNPKGFGTYSPLCVSSKSVWLEGSAHSLFCGENRVKNNASHSGRASCILLAPKGLVPQHQHRQQNLAQCQVAQELPGFQTTVQFLQNATTEETDSRAISSLAALCGEACLTFLTLPGRPVGANCL